MKIKDLPLQNRPREKAIELGISSLSNHELMMLILRHGNRTSTVSEIATNLLMVCEPLYNLQSMTVADLMKVSGIKHAKALELSAILELSKRLAKSNADSVNVINNPDAVAKWCQNEIGHLKQECFLVIYLNTAGRIISHEIVFKGTLDKSLIHPREIFHGAIKRSAASIIVVHNHPGGTLFPSEMDLIVTRRLIEASQLVQIPLVDHLIVTQSGFVSIMEDFLKTEQ